MAEVVWSEPALTSLLEAIEYISKDSPSYAASLAVQADEAATSLLQFPLRGRVVPEYRDPTVREIPVGKTYRLIYKPGPEKVYVVAFVHGARNLAVLLEDESS